MTGHIADVHACFGFIDPEHVIEVTAHPIRRKITRFKHSIRSGGKRFGKHRQLDVAGIFQIVQQILVNQVDLFRPLLYDPVEIVGIVLEFIPGDGKFQIRPLDILNKRYPENNELND